MGKMEVLEIMTSIAVIPKIEAGKSESSSNLAYVKKSPTLNPLHLEYQHVSLYQTTKIENLEGVHQVSASQRAKEIPH
jgi:hypothetical protein